VAEPDSIAARAFVAWARRTAGALATRPTVARPLPVQLAD
jgi:hypothetical protein